MSIYQDFDKQKQFACRVVADHARTTAFAIADGILPGNEGRNYVLRKIMRRAIYHGREHLGFEELFFFKVCHFVVGEMKDAYPELEIQREFIGKMVRLEEERFGNTLTVGLKKLGELIQISEENRSHNTEVIASQAPNLIVPHGLGLAISLKSLAKLLDTYGTPVDLIYVRLGELEDQISLFGKNTSHPLVNLDEDNFRKIIGGSLQELQSKGSVGKTQQSEKINPIYKSLERTSINSNFLGYETTKIETSKVVAIVKDNKKVQELKEGDEGLIVLDETPFYAEAGGQVGDGGTLVSTAYGSGQLNVTDSNDTNDKVKPSATVDGTDKTELKAGTAPNSPFTANVLDTFAPIPGITLHKSIIKSGSIKVGDTVTASVDVEKRDAIRRNHTATHLVHAALKEVLGTHVKQGGSVVAPDYLRFDFTHYQSLTETEIKDVEDLVNRYVLENELVNTNIMSIDEAKESGAVALFGEKYGSEVRVLSVGDGVFSKELCGGTHVKATGDIGAFKITSDDAVASGVRRIRAITGFNAFNRFREGEILIEKSLQAARTQRDQLPSAIEKLQEELKNSRKEIGELKLKIASGTSSNESGSSDEAKEINGVKVLAKAVDDLDKGGMRHLSDTLMAQVKSGVVIIGNRGEGKVSFIVRVSEDLTDKIRAGNIIKEIAPIVGGRGGGKPDMAEGGGSQPEKLSEAIDASYGIIENMLT